MLLGFSIELPTPKDLVLKLTSYGFIVLAPDYKASLNRTVMENENFRTEVVGVSSVDEAIVVAKELIENGIQLIELCGGFGESNASLIIDSVKSNVPIGFVGFTDKEQEKVEVLLN